MFSQLSKTIRKIYREQKQMCGTLKTKIQYWLTVHIIKSQQPGRPGISFWYQNDQLDKTKQYLMSADQLTMSNI